MAATPASMLRMVTQGLQDKSRLNSPRGQPSVEFYRSVLRQHTRWASQWRRVEFDNLADFGRTATVTLPIIGELITRVTLVVELPDLFTPQNAAAAAAAPFSRIIGPYWSWTNGIGHAVFSEAEFLIGGEVIDRVDGRLAEIIDELHSPVENWDSYNIMIARDSEAYTQRAYQGGKPTQDRLQSVEIVLPFWWNRGPGPQALPIQALAKDKVQINVKFRSVQECVYTDARVNPANPGAEATQAGPMPIMAGCGFYKKSGDPGSQPIYDMTRTGIGTPLSFAPLGVVLPGYTMPTEWHFRDAYWIVEYVSLEDREATAFRTADLQIPIEQHVAVPVTPTNGARDIRIPLPQTGLVRDITWVAQRVEATDYNAYFLFSRDLGPPGFTGSFIPWWPDATVPDWDYGDGYLRPAFADRASDPLVAAKLLTRGLPRFDHEGPSIFRSLLPTLGCQCTPLVDRYIYYYNFGFWPTGGLADALERPVDEIRGFSNWDLLQNKELVLSLDAEDCINDFSYNTLGTLYYLNDGPIVREIDISDATSFYFTLHGARKGATVSGVINLEQLKRTFGSGMRILLRMTSAGSTALLVRKEVAVGSYEYTWLAVAASGGYNAPGFPGGAASSAVAIGFRGLGQQTHNASAPVLPFYGGAGGGRYEELGVGKPDGAFVQNTQAWIYGDNTTGGTTFAAAGGDGYTGGGSGSRGGGGGGSYISQYVTQVNTVEGSNEIEQDATIVLQKNTEKRSSRRNFNIYVWLTTYNILRITRGRGALMFSAG
jgi:Major capsid protein N-terminus